MMRVRLTRRAGQPGTKRFVQRYGADLICIRYRYDDEREIRLKTVEIVVARSEWRAVKRPGDDGTPVQFRIAEGEDLLRRAVLIAGGRWEEDSDTWTLPRRTAKALGLESRIIRPRLRRQRHDQR